MVWCLIKHRNNFAFTVDSSYSFSSNYTAEEMFTLCNNMYGIGRILGSHSGGYEDATPCTALKVN
jgi:hypothetical protein